MIKSISQRVLEQISPVHEKFAVCVDNGYDVVVEYDNEATALKRAVKQSLLDRGILFGVVKPFCTIPYVTVLDGVITEKKALTFLDDDSPLEEEFVDKEWEYDFERHEEELELV